MNRSLVYHRPCSSLKGRRGAAGASTLDVRDLAFREAVVELYGDLVGRAEAGVAAQRDAVLVVRQPRAVVGLEAPRHEIADALRGAPAHGKAVRLALTMSQDRLGPEILGARLPESRVRNVVEMRPQEGVLSQRFRSSRLRLETYQRIFLRT